MSLEGIKMGRIPNFQKLAYINLEEKIITVINDVKESEKTLLFFYLNIISEKNCIEAFCRYNRESTIRTISAAAVYK
jgi:hypothetical protein